jgi:hypothetical protein
MFNKQPPHRSGVGSADVEAAQRFLGVVFPTEYRTFIVDFNGTEGNNDHIGYLSLWSLDRVVALQEAYAVAEFAPGLLLIGSDGGDAAIAYDMRMSEPALVEVPFIGMSLEEVRPLEVGLMELLGPLPGK